jgi:hypothetical protein
MFGTIGLHYGRWRARWRVEGQRHSRLFDTREEAEAFLQCLAEERARLQRSVAERQGAVLSVAEILSEYLHRRSRRLEKSTQHNYEQLLR